MTTNIDSQRVSAFEIPIAELPVFRDGNLHLRRLVPEDAPAFAALANNPNISANTSDRFPYPYTLETAQGFVQKANTQGFACIWAIEWQGQLAGGVGLHPREDINRFTAEIGYWLGEPFWGQGIVSRTIGLVCRWALQNTTLHRIEAKVMGHNPASGKVLEKNSFRKEGHLRQATFKRGQWVDDLVYGLLLTDLPR